ncbi:MAG TPA: class I SAM-dependent methyltransferase [Alphaproteobacteria bacterium]|nr:class I SAM-dependent methyltransferase [Alphaproteobacteria bacterium]
MASLKELQRDWDHLAQTDPLWAICSDPSKRHQQWTVAEFFATGEHEVGSVLSYLSSLRLHPDFAGHALDFGCGVGRLTRALAARFQECWGVDVSPAMIQKAKELNADCRKCKFALNESPDLRQFGSGQISMVYSSIVLQHMPRRQAEAYICEFIRVLKPQGILVFQVADRLKATAMERLRGQLALRRRMRRVLPAARPDEDRMVMHCMSEREVRRALPAEGVSLVDVRCTNSTDPAFNGNLRYLDCEPSVGYVSEQYCIVKRG